MSSPIAIPRRAVSPASDRIPMAASPSSPSGLYVPVHRRSPSASGSVPSSSPRASSSPLTPTHPEPQPHSRVYTPAALLALQPPALTPTLKAEIHARISAACPEVLANARMRKSAAFRMHRAKGLVVPQPTTAPNQTTNVSPSAVDIPATSARPTPRRTRPTGRGPERRRAALQLANNWRVPARATVAAPISVL